MPILKIERPNNSGTPFKFLMGAIDPSEIVIDETNCIAISFADSRGYTATLKLSFSEAQILCRDISGEIGRYVAEMDRPDYVHRSEAGQIERASHEAAQREGK